MKSGWIAYCAMLALAVGATAAPEYLSPGAVAARSDGSRLYIAAETAARILTFDPGTGKSGPSFKLPGDPTGLSLSPDGARLAITCDDGQGQGRICILDAAAGTVIKEFPAGHSPVAPCFSRDGATIFVGQRFKNEVAAYDAASGAVRFRTAVLREPLSLALTPDGTTLVAANHLPADAATADVVSA